MRNPTPVPAEGTLFDQVAAEALDAGMDQHQALRALKGRLIVNSLKRNRSNQSKAARELHVHRNTLSRDIHQLGLRAAVFGFKKDVRSDRRQLQTQKRIESLKAAS